MILHSLCCFIFFVFVQSSSEQIPGIDTVDEDAAPNLQEDFAAVMQEIRVKSPVLYRQLQNKPRKQMLAAMFRALNSGVMTDEDFQQREAVLKKSSPRQQFCGLLPDKRLLYCRTDRLDCVEMRNAFRKYPSVLGLILDLRTAVGNDYDQVLPLLELLQGKKIPVAVLTGPGSYGAPALFTAMVCKKPSFITMGQRGNGYLFPTVKATLPNGVWHLPLVEEVYADILPDGIAPRISYKVGTRITDKGLRSPAAVSKDALLTFAGDFLISRLVLK